MTGVRDPAFWRRFSMAVHMDEEKANMSDTTSMSTSTSATKNHTKQQDDWLERNRKKSRKTMTIGCLIALLTLLLVGGVVIAMLWLAKTGPFQPLGT